MHQKHNTNQQTGFTLIELLVVIAIIGILASVVLISLNVAREKSRDATRFAQMREVHKALEAYYADNGSYPSPGGGPYFYLEHPTPASELAPTYISTIPQDPMYGAGEQEGNDYRYHSTSDGFVLLMQHEGSDGWCRIQAGGDTYWSSNSTTNTPCESLY